MEQRAVIPSLVLSQQRAVAVAVEVMAVLEPQAQHRRAALVSFGHRRLHGLVYREEQVARTQARE